MTKQVIVMRKDLNMRKGKIAAQAAHASLGVFTENMVLGELKHSGEKECDIATLKLTPEMVEWFENSFTKICVSCEDEIQLLAIVTLAKQAGLPCKLIVDNGQTEFHGVPTATCCAIGPANSKDIDKITGHLKLL